MVDAARGRVLRRLDVGGPARHLGVDPSLRRLWVPLGNEAAAVAVVDVDEPARPRLVRRFAPVDRAHDVVFGADGAEVWVTSGTGTRSRSTTRGRCARCGCWPRATRRSTWPSCRAVGCTSRAATTARCTCTIRRGAGCGARCACRSARSTSARTARGRRALAVARHARDPGRPRHPAAHAPHRPGRARRLPRGGAVSPRRRFATVVPSERAWTRPSIHRTRSRWGSSPPRHPATPRSSGASPIS